MPHLQEEGAIAKTVAALDAFGAPDTQSLVDGVLKVGILDKGPFNSRSWAQTIFGPRIQLVRFGLEVTGAKLAIAANGVGVHALHRGLLQHTMGRAVAAPQAFLRIDLPQRATSGSSHGDS